MWRDRLQLKDIIDPHGHPIPPLTGSVLKMIERDLARWGQLSAEVGQPRSSKSSECAEGSKTLGLAVPHRGELVPRRAVGVFYFNYQCM